jgi:hypothetical protein
LEGIHVSIEALVGPSANLKDKKVRSGKLDVPCSNEVYCREGFIQTLLRLMPCIRMASKAAKKNDQAMKLIFPAAFNTFPIWHAIWII